MGRGKGARAAEGDWGMTKTKPATLKRYSIRVRGFDAHEVVARTPSEARYKNFLAYDDAGYGPRGSKTLRFWDFVNRIEAFHHLGAAG